MQILRHLCCLLVAYLPYYLALKMEALFSSETSVNFCQVTLQKFKIAA
jgi:hypothetical protein